MHCQKLLSLSLKLNALDPKRKSTLCSYLLDPTLQELSSPPFNEPLIPIKMTVSKLIKRVDISHYKYFLNTLSAGEKNFYAAAFPKHQQSQLFDEKIIFKEYRSEKFSNYVLNMLFKKVFKSCPPPFILIHHPILELLVDVNIPLSKLVYFLGLYDVTFEIKKIISKKTLFSLQMAFEKDALDYMNILAQKRDQAPLSSMNLSAYEGDKEKLFALILERGIYRLSQGIKKAPNEYRFFFTYFLPKSLSDQLLKLLKTKEFFAPLYTNWENDALDTWRFLCTYSQ